jgi:hypothetical protein
MNRLSIIILMTKKKLNNNKINNENITNPTLLSVYLKIFQHLSRKNIFTQ